MTKKADLSVNFCGVRFPNPFCLSSSPVGNHAEMCARAFDAGWGGIAYKTLNVEKSFKVVMPSPRLNAFHYNDKRFVGLQNAEQITDRPLEDNLRDLAELRKKYPDRVIISSIMGFTADDWALLAKKSEEVGADLLELNFSCPQMARKDAGHRVGQDYDLVERFTAVVKKASRLPVMAKMTPNITDMVPVALAAKRGGADAIAAINTIRAITDIDLESFTPMPIIFGKSGITGFSGPAAKPVGMRFVSELYNCPELGLPIAAIGGVETWRDALHYILLGGGTIQVTTAIMRYGYRIVEDLIEGLSDFMIERGISNLEELRGAAAKKLIDPSDFDVRFDAERRKASVDEKRCVGCTLCRHVCPVWDCITTRTVDTAATPHAAIF